MNASFLDSPYSLPPRGLPGGTKEAPGELGQQENHWRLVLGQREFVSACLVMSCFTWFLSFQFTKKSVVDAYTGFIRNVKRADDAIKIARTTKPAFDRFLQDMRRGKVERLSLTDLLAKPFQRIPRYRLLLQVRQEAGAGCRMLSRATVSAADGAH